MFLALPYFTASQHGHLNFCELIELVSSTNKLTYLNQKTTSLASSIRTRKTSTFILRVSFYTKFKTNCPAKRMGNGLSSVELTNMTLMVFDSKVFLK